MEASNRMDLSSSQGEGSGHKVDHDVNNEQQPYQDAIVVLFHLDMTDLRTQHKEICQIAASCNGQKFQVYIKPDCHYIATDSTKVHGISLRKNKNMSYNLVQNNVVVNSFSPKEGLTQFLGFLSNLTGTTRKVLLVAHNCSSFQRHMLVHQLKECNLIDSFQLLVLGTIDTLEVFKKILNSPDQETKKEKDSYDLDSLVEKYLKAKFIVGGQRDANISVKILESLIEIIGCTDAILKQHVKDLDVFIRAIDLKNELGDVVSSTIREKIASAGITIDVLKDEYRANGDEGVSKLLKEKLTTNKTTIQKLTVGLSRLLDGNTN